MQAKSQIHQLISARRPDQEIIYKNRLNLPSRKFWRPSEPQNENLKKCGKRNQFFNLAKELRKLRNVRVTAIGFVIGVLGKGTGRVRNQMMNPDHPVKTFQFQVIQFIQTVLIQAIQILFTQLNVKTVLYQTIQLSVNTVSMSKTVPFQTIQFSISTQFRCKYNLIVKNIFILSDSVYSNTSNSSNSV